MTTGTGEKIGNWFQPAAEQRAQAAARQAAIEADLDVTADDPPGSGRHPVPPLSSGTRFVVQLMTLQLLCIGVLTLLGHADRALLVTAAVLPALLALSVLTVRSRTVGGWFALWLRWRRRHALARKVSAQGEPVNPLWLLTRRLRIGSVRGFRHSEVGVLHLDRTWVSVAWVTTGPRADAPDAPDGLTALLGLPPSATPGATTFALLQQDVTDLGSGPAPQLSAWISLNVQPLAALEPKLAIGAVPLLTRAEIRHLNQHCADGVLTLVPLDRSDLLQALAMTTEVPLTPSPASEPLDESWQLWQARGRFHRAFRLHPGTRHPLPVLVSLAMDLAAQDADCVLTVCVPFVAGRRRLHELPVLRVSSPDPTQALDLTDEIMVALEQQGAATAPLSGEHGPALLTTSILAGAARR